MSEDRPKECPNCKSTNITIEDINSTFNGDIMDYKCLDCKHEWVYEK